MLRQSVNICSCGRRIMYTLLAVLVVSLAVFLSGCMYPEMTSESNPLRVAPAEEPVIVQVIGIVTDNGTVYSTSELLDGSITDIDGLVAGDGSNVYVIDLPSGEIVGTMETQTLSNKGLASNFDINGYSFDAGSGWMVMETTGTNTGFSIISDQNGADGANFKTVFETDSLANNDTAFRFFIKGNDKSLVENSWGVERMFCTDSTQDGEDWRWEWFASGNGSLVQSMRLDDSDLWVLGDVSADSITDRTPYFKGDAVSSLTSIKPVIGNGEIDHETLPEFVKVERKYPIYDADYNVVGYEFVTERSLGAMVSVLTKAVAELDAKNKELEARLAALEAGK